VDGNPSRARLSFKSNTTQAPSGQSATGGREHRGRPTGLNIGVILLEHLIPGSSAVTPQSRPRSLQTATAAQRSWEADRHGIEILRRAGYSKEVMIDTLTVLTRTSGGDMGGGFLFAHPGNRRAEQRFEETGMKVDG